MLLESLLQDVQFALRTMRRSPAFTATAILTLGVGLGLNTMLFTLFDAYVLRPVAVSQPYSLYQLSMNLRTASSFHFDWDQFRQLRAQAPAFSDSLAAASFGTRSGTRGHSGLLVSDNYFSLLGVKMAAGRPILPDDRSVAVLSYRLWQSMFHGSDSTLGRTLLVNGNPLEIIGICSADFDGMPPGDTPPDFYVPAAMQTAVAPTADRWDIVARLRPGVSQAQAQASTSVIVRNLTAQLPDSERALSAGLTSRATAVALDARTLAVFSPLLVVFGLVLVICCANVANMMLARALARQREIGLRLSLGAARGRIIRQLLTESLLLASLAGLLGLAISNLGLAGIQRVLISTMPKSYAGLIVLAPLATDRRVLLFLFLASAAATVISGLAPALQVTGMRLMGAMGGEFSRFRSARLRGALVVSQVAVCLLLLVLTGVLLRNSAALQRIAVGYETHGVVSPLIFSQTAAADSAKLARNLEGQPWVAALAVAMRAPMSGRVRTVPVIPSNHAQAERAGYNMVSGAYFELLHIPILRGRSFAANDDSVAIVSQATARRFWPGQEPIGKTLDVPQLHSRAVVIGVAKDVASGMLFDGADRTMVYFPVAIGSDQARVLLVRGKADSATTRELVEQSLSAVLPDRGSLAVALEDSFVLQVYPFRAAMAISLVLGAVALLLTVSGMYGVMSYIVGQRVREIGIRMALGASPRGVIGLVLRQSGRLAALGLTFGLALSLALAKLLSAAFFMLRPFDLAAYAGGLAVVALAMLAASWIPSRRASLIHPVDALRAD